MPQNTFAYHRYIKYIVCCRWLIMASLYNNTRDQDLDDLQLFSIFVP